MEYNAVNIALKGERQGEYHMSTLGPVRLLGDRVRLSRARAARRKRPSSRASPTARNEPQLAFMADDALYYSGLDPRVNTFDLGTDPLVYAERQLKLGRELWQLTETRALQARRELRAAAPQLQPRAVRSAAKRACRRPSTSAA